jgi:hydrogenase maturation protease
MVMSPMVYVLGLGNVLMGDDGFGPAAIRAFEAEYTVPDGVEVVDLGTPGLDLLPWLADVPQVILVDTVKSDQPPGTMRIYDKADLMRHAPMARVGPHDPGVKDALHALEFAGRAPGEVVVIGVVPGRTELDLALTPAVEASLPGVVAEIRATLERFGTPPQRRPH